MEIESFDGQKDDEEIVAAWREHPMVLAKPMLVIILLIFFGSIPAFTWAPSWRFDFWLIFVAAGLIYALVSYLLYFNTVYILSSERIIAVSQRAFLMRRNTEVPLKNIQNVSHLKKGLFQMIFDYGSVEIETSGAKTALIIKNIEHPYLAQQKILSYENKEKKDD